MFIEIENRDKLLEDIQKVMEDLQPLNIVGQSPHVNWLITYSPN